MKAMNTFLKRLERLRLRMPAHPPGREGLVTPLPGVFNPTFAPSEFAPDANLAVLCRETYYTLDSRSYMVGPPDIARVRNILVGLTTQGSETREIWRRHVPGLDGMEDVRLYGFRGVTYFSAVRLNPPPGPLHNQVIGKIRPDLSVEVRTPVENLAPVEKNWVFFRRGDDLWIEKWPGAPEAYRVDPETLALTFVASGPVDHRWSGTKSAPFGAGDLFLDHRRIYLFDGGKLPLRFIFRLRYQPGGGGPPVVSRPFSLHRHDRLVYVSDLSVSGDVVRIGYGIDDAETSFTEINVADARAFLGLSR